MSKNGKINNFAFEQGKILSLDTDKSLLGLYKKTQTFRIEKVLGAGGFGITYKVCRLEDGLIVALKEYFPDKICERAPDSTMSYFSTNAEEVKRGLDNFVTEAVRLKREKISHPNIVGIGSVLSGYGTAFYEMEYVAGLNLLQYVGKYGALSVEQALSVMRPILHAVSMLHQNRLTHLDIKHENIILKVEEDGSFRPVLIDFGQSKHYDKKGNATTELTNAGCSAGFAPPEQYLGLTKFTPQADVYALTATFLFLITGRTPKKSSEINSGVILEMLGDDCPENVKETILSGMKTNKEDRLQSVGELAERLGLDLSEVEGDSHVTRLLKTKQVKANVKTDYKKVSILAIVLLVVTVGVIFLLNGNRHPASISDFDSMASIDPVDSTEVAVVSETNNLEAKANEENVLSQEKVDESSKSNVNQLEESKTATDNKPAAPEPAKETKPVKESDEELLARAQKTNDIRLFTELANRNNATAIIHLARYYYNQDTPSGDSQADKWAKKGKALGLSQADEIIKNLEKRGLYD